MCGPLLHNPGHALLVLFDAIAHLFFARCSLGFRSVPKCALQGLQFSYPVKHYVAIAKPTMHHLYVLLERLQLSYSVKHYVDNCQADHASQHVVMVLQRVPTRHTVGFQLVQTACLNDFNSHILSNNIWTIAKLIMHLQYALLERQQFSYPVKHYVENCQADHASPYSLIILQTQQWTIAKLTLHHQYILCLRLVSPRSKDFEPHSLSNTMWTIAMPTMRLQQSLLEGLQFSYYVIHYVGNCQADHASSIDMQSVRVTSIYHIDLAKHEMPLLMTMSILKSLKASCMNWTQFKTGYIDFPVNNFFGMARMGSSVPFWRSQTAFGLILLMLARWISGSFFS